MPTPLCPAQAIACAAVALLLAAGCEEPPEARVGDDDAGFNWGDGPPATPDGGATADAGAPPGDDAGMGGDAGDGGTATGTFSVVVLPDTQYYSAYYPQTFDAQASWIVKQRDAGHIAFVLHEGDIVDNDEQPQWEHALHSLGMLDGVVPYLVSAGNHDYCCAGWPTDHTTTMMNRYFPVSAFATRAWFKGTYEPGRIENSYAIVDVPNVPASDRHWLLMSLEFGPRDEVLVWADGVLKQNAQLPAMIVTHAYLYSDGMRYDYATRPYQMWNPHSYPVGMQPGAANDGEEMWQKLIEPNSNVRFVFSGHVLDNPSKRLTSTRADGTIVHQLLVNYQDYDKGGDGFLRLLQFFPGQRIVHAQTYSPTYDMYIDDPDNDFVLSY